jgi:hypothetical protein
MLQKVPLRTADDAKRVAAAWLKLSAEAMSAGQFDRAEKAASSAAANARKAKDIPSVTRAEALSKEAADLRNKYKGLAQARQTLQTQPDDAAANTLVGRFECFVEGTWPAGLEKLAKGSDTALRDAANAELSASRDAAKTAAAADSWRTLADKESGPNKVTILRHALALYQGSLSGLTGLSKARVDKRIEELVKVAGVVSEVNLLGMIDLKMDLCQGNWSTQGATLVSDGVAILEIPYVPPDEYDLKLKVERKGGSRNIIVGLVVGGRQVGIGIDQDEISGLARIDGKTPDQNETGYRGTLLPLNKERFLFVSVRKTGVAMTVDGQKIFDWKGEAGRLSRNPATPVRSNHVMYLVSAEAQFVIRQITLSPLSGPGKPLR